VIHPWFSFIKGLHLSNTTIVAFRIIWCRVLELFGVMPGVRELSGVSKRRSSSWASQVNDLQLISNEVVEAARDIL
jgi:hypothetical protein